MAIVDASVYISNGGQGPTRKTSDGTIEKIPRIHQSPGRRTRYILMCDAAGNVLHCVLTNAAGHENPDADEPAPYARRMATKWSANGWFPYKVCPLLSVANGDLMAYDLMVKTTDSPCSKDAHRGGPCKHGIAESAARKDKQRLLTEEREIRFRPEADKAALEAQAVATQTSDSVGKLAETFSAFIASQQGAKEGAGKAK